MLALGCLRVNMQRRREILVRMPVRDRSSSRQDGMMEGTVVAKSL